MQINKLKLPGVPFPDIRLKVVTGGTFSAFSLSKSIKESKESRKPVKPGQTNKSWASAIDASPAELIRKDMGMREILM